MVKALSEYVIELQGQINGLQSYYWWLVDNGDALGNGEVIKQEIFQRITHLHEKLFAGRKLAAMAGLEVPWLLRDGRVAQALIQRELLSPDALKPTLGAGTISAN
jgi:hypothetical protein